MLYHQGAQMQKLMMCKFGDNSHHCVLDNANPHSLMMCCKSGRQFEEYYLARKAGKMYK